MPELRARAYVRPLCPLCGAFADFTPSEPGGLIGRARCDCGWEGPAAIVLEWYLHAPKPDVSHPDAPHPVKKPGRPKKT